MSALFCISGAQSPDRPRESLTGLIRRIARHEGFTDLSQYYSVIGRTYGRPMLEDLIGLAEDLQISSAELEMATPAEGPGTPPELQWSFHHGDCDPFCPACLGGEGVWRPEWRVCWVTACSHHGIRLRDDCDRCGERLTVRSGGLYACSCGYPLSRMRREAASAGEMEVARLVLGTSNAFDVEPVVDEEANRLLRFLGANGKVRRTGKEGKTPLPRTIDDAVRAIAHAGDILTRWPDAFDDEVRRRWREGPSDGRTAAQRLGPWYRQLAVLQGPYAQALKKRLKEVTAAELGDLYARPADIDAADKHWLSVAEGAEWLGISQDRLRSAIRSGHLEAKEHRAGFGHAHTIVRRSAVEEVRARRAEYIDAKAARARLGVTKTQFALLLEAEAIVPAADGKDMFLIDGRIHLPTLKGQVAAIAAKACPAILDAQDTVAFRDLNLRRTTDRGRLLDLFRAVFRGDLGPARAEDGDLLSDFRFQVSDVQEVLTGAPIAVLTAADVSRIASWKPECVTHWCKEGILQARQVREKGIDQWQITPSDLASFQATYAVVADVAGARGTTSRGLLRWCAEKGIEVIGQKALGGTSRGSLVRISDLFGL